MSLYDALVYFPLYSFLGWCLEVCYQAVSKGLVVNRGFLNGPICPIYGIGVIGCVLIVESVFDMPVDQVPGLWLFAFGLVFATGIELAGGWILDKLFHARWWDYRDRRFNMNGYVCLEFSIIWGLGIVFVLREIYPFISRLLSFMRPSAVSYIILAVTYLVIAADIVVSAMIVAGMNRRFKDIDDLSRLMRRTSDRLSTRIGEGTIDRVELLAEKTIETRYSIDEIRDELEANLASRKRALLAAAESRRFVGMGRLIRAYPDMRHRYYDDILSEIRKHIESGPKR